MNFETFKEITRIEQTLFGLPFVLSGVLLALLGYPFSLSALLWVFPAFLMARISGMAFNQLIDRKIDAKNPRTKNRPIPAGRVTVTQARVIAWGALLLFLLITWRINFLCFAIAPFAAFLLVIYSYMKRVHASCHFILSMIHFLGPVMAFIALSGTCHLSVVMLGLAASMSIAGTDIAYAMQDYTFDVENRLHSIPARFGIKKSMRIAQFLHLFCLIFLVLTGIFAKLPMIYYGLILIVGCVFAHFHTTLGRQYKKTGSISCLESIMFFSNVAVSFTTFLFILFSALWVVLL